MPGFLGIRRVSWLLATLMAGFCVAAAQDKETPRSPQQPRPTPYILGETSCAPCHGDPSRATETCRMIESRIWEARDPHRNAMAWGTKSDAEGLSPAARRAWEIGDALGINDVTTDARCTGCHSIVADTKTPRQDFGEPARQGVSCVACHGAYLEWLREHSFTEDPKWRTLTREQKWQEKGMVDLWNPVQRARVCLSCHVGDPDPDQHKTITHAMFQAGHPPLGTIELAAACDEQPRHWQLMRCKAQPAQQRQGFKIGRMEQAELVAAGALLTLQRSAEMLASQLESSGPDFARYDCTACHHELPRPLPSLTLAEQDNAFAGRPLEPRWSRALVDVGLIAAADDKSAESTQPLRDQLGALHEALSHQPFGDRTRTIEAARNLARWLDRPLDALSEKARPAATKVVDLETERRMIRQLCATGSDSLCDFDTARQRAWALRSLWSEYSASSPKLPAGTKRRVDALLARLDEELQLSLGWRHLDLNDACALEDLANTQHPRSSTILGEPLRNRLGAAMRFNRESFAKTLAEIATELGDSK